MNDTPFALHNPALLPADILLGEFTARRALLDTLLRIVRDNTSGKPPQHVVLIGARGMGKTTTLWAVAHSIAGQPELARQWQPVVFDEESRRVGDLADFWLEAIRQWELATHSIEGQAERLLAQAGRDLELQARSAFLSAIDRSGRRAVLFVDNLNEVFASIHDPEPLHRLRALLMEDDRIMILGAATRHFDAITGLDEPFFDFFRIFELTPLTLEDMQATLLALAQRRGDARVIETIGQRPGTIRSLHILTGGNPRLVKTFYRLLAEGLRGDVRQELERLVDEFTPYFKAILDALPVQQQRILDAVALAWEPVEVAAVAQATRIPSNQVSAQLRNLVRSGIAAEAAGSPKRKTYLLADRFSNIHYLMRHGRTARRRFDWFVLTLRALFPDPEQADALARVAGRTACTGDEGMRDTRDLLASALSQAENDDSRQRILRATIKDAWDQETLAKFDEWLDLDLAKQHLPSYAGELDIVVFFGNLPTELRKSLGYNPDDSRWWYGLTDVLEEREAWSLAEAAYRKAIELDSKFAYPWYGIGNLLLEHLSRPAEAEAAYRKAIELDSKFAYPWHSLGYLLQEHLGRPTEAEAAYRKAIELDPKYASLWNGLGSLLQDHLARPAEAETAYRKAIELDSKLAYPWNNLGNLLQGHLGRPVEAEAAYRKATELDPKSAIPWNGLGSLLQDHLGRPIEAEAAYRKAIELDPKYASPWSNLGNLLRNHLARPAEAEAAYRKAIELDPKDAYPWNGLGHLLREAQDRPAEAEAAYRKAIELDAKFAYPWNGLGNLLRETQDRPAEAEAAYRKAIELDPKFAYPWNNLGILLKNDLGRLAEAEAAYRKAIELDPKFAFPWNNLGNLLEEYLGRPAEAETAYRKAIELEPEFAHSYSGLARVLSKSPGMEEEARAAATRGLALKPDYRFAQRWFHELCVNDAPSWQLVLPPLAAWCATHPKDTAVFDFTMDGFIRYARLTSPAEAAKLRESVADPLPFEILWDAFRAHADREHLHRLAPERRTLVLEVLSRLAAES